jgi:ankyrin repeat protein
MVAVAGLLSSCETRQEIALRELNRRGIEASGSTLIEAVTRGDRTTVAMLLAAGVYVEQRDAAGRTPLRIAVEQKDLDSCRLLVDNQANVNIPLPDGSSLLGVAVEQENIPLIKLLIEAGAKADAPMPGGEAILPWAVRRGNAMLVQTLMATQPDPHLKDKEGNPLLHIAMETDHRSLVETLLKEGADPGAVNARGETTLHLAIRNGWYDLIPALAKAGADPNFPAPAGPSPLSQAVIDGKTDLVALLLKSGADPNYRHPFPEKEREEIFSRTPLELAFLSPDQRVFQVFLDHKVRFDPERANAWLWGAFQDRNLTLARMLLARGASLKTTSDGWLPIEAAVIRDDPDFVKLFSDYGSPAGRSLHLAISKGSPRMVELLLAFGADPDVTHPPFTDRPLTIAIRRRDDALAAALVSGGAGLEYRLAEGQSPLHLAVAKGCPKTVRLLLMAGADPNTPFQLPAKAEFVRQVRPGIMRWCLKSDRNVTLLMLAIDSGNTAVTRALLDAGAKTQVWTRISSLWPINFASRRGDVKMMRLILGRDPQREERHIVIAISEQRARMFDSEGTEIFNTKVSTGKKGYDTPTGEYVITNKYRDWTSTLYHASMPYFQRLSCSDFGLHAGVVPGYPASHGCIRVPAANAAKLFSMTQAGDRVRIIP